MEVEHVALVAIISLKIKVKSVSLSQSTESSFQLDDKHEVIKHVDAAEQSDAGALCNPLLLQKLQSS